jgi:protocatechuate 3,4-dioxygenase beta subunit
MRKRLGAVIVSALAITAVTMTWWAFSAGRAVPPVHEEPGSAAVLAMPGSSATAATLVPGDQRPTDHLARTPVGIGEAVRVAIRGTVVDKHGKPIEGARVHAHPSGVAASARTPRAVEGPPPPPLAVALTDLQGSYALDLPRRSAAYVVDVHCTHMRFLRQCVPDQAVRNDVEAVVDFIMSPGGVIRGWASQRGGGGEVGCRGVPLVAISGRPHRSDAPFAVSSEWDVAPFRYVTRGSSVCTGETIVLEDGQFEFTGLAPGSYRLLSADPDWIVSPAVEAATDTPAVHLNLTPALALRIRAVSGARKVPGFRAHLTLLSRGTEERLGPDFAVGSSGDSVVVTLDRHVLGERIATIAPGEAVRARYRVIAQGFEDARGAADLELDAGMQEVVVDLGTLARPMRPLVLDVAYVDGPWPVEKGLDLRYAPEDTAQSVHAAVRRVDGRWLAEMPEGRWWVRVMPHGPMGWATAVAREVVVGPAGGELLGVVFPRCGRLRVWSGRTGSLSVVIAGPTFSRDFVLEPGETLIEDLPAGSWQVIWKEGGVDQQLTTVVTESGLAEISIPRGTAGLGR